jgi:hypothetical protein
MQADLLGHLFAYDENGNLLEIEPMTGDIIGEDATGVGSTGGNWAIMVYEDQIYLFNGTGVARYDIVSRTLTVLGDLGINVVGASAVPCLSSP